MFLLGKEVVLLYLPYTLWGSKRRPVGLVRCLTSDLQANSSFQTCTTLFRYSLLPVPNIAASDTTFSGNRRFPHAIPQYCAQGGIPNFGHGCAALRSRVIPQGKRMNNLDN